MSVSRPALEFRRIGSLPPYVFATINELKADLRRSGADRRLLPAVADASPGKQGLRMPGTDIPVISPAELTAEPPSSVVLFLSDLLPEVRAAYPEIEAAGGRWVDADTLTCPAGSGGLQQDT